MEDEMERTSQQHQQIDLLTSELDTWKQKFINLNRDYNKSQQDLIVCQSELESVKKEIGR
jgi:hypothetical protein